MIHGLVDEKDLSLYSKRHRTLQRCTHAAMNTLRLSVTRLRLEKLKKAEGELDPLP